MEYNRVKPNPVQEAQAQSQFIEFSENSPSDLDNGKLGRLRRMGRRREDTEVALDFTLGSDRIQKSGNSVLEDRQIKKSVIKRV